MSIKEKGNNRILALDLIRCVACFSVISVHFLLNNGFYDENVNCKSMYIMVVMRQFFMMCVPLFLMLSGYLMKNKKIELKYYVKFLKIYIIYIFASVFCFFGQPALYKIIGNFFNLPYHDFKPLTIPRLIKGILDYTAAPYAWYIEMYIGLFLFIPFLNIIWNSLKTKKNKKLLVLLCVLTMALPTIINVYNYTSIEWWKNPTALSPEGGAYPQFKLLPSWWINFYPIMYYYIGCYLNEYKEDKINKVFCVVMVLLTTVAWGLYCIWRSGGTIFQRGLWSEYNSLFCVMLSVYIFKLLDNPYRKMPKVFVCIIQSVSELSLCIFLVSRVFDLVLYGALVSYVPNISARLKYYFVIVPAVFLLSIMVSFVIDYIYKILEKLVKHMVNKIRGKEEMYLS